MALAALAAGAVLATAACGATQSGSSAAKNKTQAKTSGTIALLLPESKTARYEAADRPFFVKKLAEICPKCKVDYKNANQEPSLQQQQADAALANKDDVLVIDAVDSVAAAKIVDKAKSQGTPVLSYERLILNSEPDQYISFDNVKVGEAQAQSILDKLGPNSKSKKIVMINGSPTDNNAKLFKQGAHKVFDGKVTIAKEYDTPDWSPDKAQQEMQQAITAVGKNNIAAVYCANDGTAGGAIAAMKAAGMSPIPPTTGQDAEVAGLQRIVAGEQYMTVYKPIKDEAEKAAVIAYDLLQKKKIDTTETTDNGKEQVPSTLLPIQAVTADKLKSTVIKDGWVTPAQLCSGQYAAGCAKLGIS